MAAAAPGHTGDGAPGAAGGQGRPRRRVSRGDPDRRPRQKPDTATAWSATTSSAVEVMLRRRFCAPRLARSARPCFDLEAMPRVRLTARSWLAAGCSWRRLRACRRWRRRARAGKRLQRRRRRGRAPADAEARRREELDAVQRQDVADALQACHYNITVDWRHDAARSADRHPRCAPPRRPTCRQRLGCQRRLAALQLGRAGGAAPDTAHFRDSGRPAQPAAAAAERPRPWLTPKFKPMPARPDAKTYALLQSGRGSSGRRSPRGPNRGAPVSERSRRGHPPDVCRPSGRRRHGNRQGDPDGLITPTFAPRRRFHPRRHPGPRQSHRPARAGGGAFAPHPGRRARGISPRPRCGAGSSAPPVQMAPPAPARW